MLLYNKGAKMETKRYKAESITIYPIKTAFYMPPTVFGGDPVGHVGQNDMFFLVLKGEIILFIEDFFYIMKAGQLAFLPKGKMRRYFSFSNDYKVYSMSFYAQGDGVNLMQGLGYTQSNYVVTPKNLERVVELFENSSHVEFNKNAIHNVIWSANILNIIKEFSKEQKIQFNSDERLNEVVDYMKANVDKNVTVEELSSIVYMQPTYFIRCFKKSYGYSPMAYFKTLKLCKAMQLLNEGELSVDKVADSVGMIDASYFSRWFKNNCGVTPSEYKKQLYKNVE